MLMRYHSPLCQKVGRCREESSLEQVSEYTLSWDDCAGEQMFLTSAKARNNLAAGEILDDSHQTDGEDKSTSVLPIKEPSIHVAIAPHVTIMIGIHTEGFRTSRTKFAGTLKSE